MQRSIATGKMVVTAMEQDSLLLKLPAELRNRIYRTALVSSDALDVTDKPRPTEPALLATCKQIRTEALGIYYSENSFLLSINIFNRYPGDQPDTFMTWASSLGATRRDLIGGISRKPQGGFGNGCDEVLDAANVDIKLRSYRIAVLEGHWLAELARTHKQDINSAGLSVAKVSYIAPDEVKTLADVMKVAYNEAGELASLGRLPDNVPDELIFEGHGTCLPRWLTKRAG